MTIEVKDLWKRFGKFEALRGLSFSTSEERRFHRAGFLVWPFYRG